MRVPSPVFNRLLCVVFATFKWLEADGAYGAVGSYGSPGANEGHGADWGFGTETGVLRTSQSDKSAKWIAELRRSLMHDNYDYQSLEPAPLDDKLAVPTSGQASAESSEDSDSSGEHCGDPPATPRLTNDSPYPRAPSTQQQKERQKNDIFSLLSSHRTRGTRYPDRLPSSKLWHRATPVTLGREANAIARGDSYRPGDSKLASNRGNSRKEQSPESRPQDAPSETVLPLWVDDEFEKRRQSYLESLYELEDQLWPVYMRSNAVTQGKGASGVNRQNVEHRGASTRHPGPVNIRRPQAKTQEHKMNRPVQLNTRQSHVASKHHTDKKMLVKLQVFRQADSDRPYVDAQGIKRYKVDKNNIKSFKVFGDATQKSEYSDGREAAWRPTRFLVGTDRPNGNQNSIALSHQKVPRKGEKDSDTIEESDSSSISEYSHDGKQMHSEYWDVESSEVERGLEYGDHINIKPYFNNFSVQPVDERKSKYLERARLEVGDLTGYVQRYASRRNGELLEDASASRHTEASFEDASASSASSKCDCATTKIV